MCALHVVHVTLIPEYRHPCFLLFRWYALCVSQLRWCVLGCTFSCLTVSIASWSFPHVFPSFVSLRALFLMASCFFFVHILVDATYPQWNYYIHNNIFLCDASPNLFTWQCNILLFARLLFRCASWFCISRCSLIYAIYVASSTTSLLRLVVGAHVGDVIFNTPYAVDLPTLHVALT